MTFGKRGTFSVNWRKNSTLHLQCQSLIQLMAAAEYAFQQWFSCSITTHERTDEHWSHWCHILPTLVYIQATCGILDSATKLIWTYKLRNSCKVYLLENVFLCHCTFSATPRTTFVNSVTTISTHLSEGSFSRSICFLTIVSNAMSGVKRPVLWKYHIRLFWSTLVNSVRLVACHQHATQWQLSK